MNEKMKALANNPEFLNCVMEANSAEEVLGFLKKEGIEFSQADLLPLMEMLMKPAEGTVELDEDDLEKVIGGVNLPMEKETVEKAAKKLASLFLSFMIARI